MLGSLSLTGSLINRQMSGYKTQYNNATSQSSAMQDDEHNKKVTGLFSQHRINQDINSHHHISSIVYKAGDTNVIQNKVVKQCQKVLPEANLQGKSCTRPAHTSPILPFEIICDIDSPDSNNAILPDFVAAILAGHPTVTSRTLFRAAHSECFSLINKLRSERDLVMIHILKRYEIYAKGAFLIFIPKHLGNLTQDEKFERLDLDRQSLQNISMEEAWKQIDEEPEMEGFKKLFSAEPKYSKAIHIAGHGWVGSPAGLTKEHYQEFLQWAEEQHCRGLLITSCYSGGESTLLHIPLEGGEEKEHLLHSRQKGVPFPVFVQSIGDFPVPGQFESNMHRFFSKLIEDLNHPGALSLSKVRKAVQEIEKGKNKDRLTLLQVYFPHSDKSPGGFQSVGECVTSGALTYTLYRQQQIEKGKITVSDLHFLELSPAIIKCPIQFTGGDAIFLSMIPGKAHHLLARVDLKKYSPQEYLRESVNMYDRSNVGVIKALFIGTLSSSGQELNQVFINLKNGECGYCEEGKYYLWNPKKGEDPIEVSPLQYMLRWKTLMIRTTPKDAAIRSTTGGQQNVEEVERQLSTATFWGDQQNIYEKYQELLQKNNLQNISIERLQLLLDKIQPTKSEIISMVYHLLMFRNEATACSLYRAENLSPDNITIETNVSLLNVGASFNCLQFLSILMSQSPDLNQPDPLDGSTPIVYSLKKGYSELFNWLLEQESVDLMSQDRLGNPAFVYSIFHPEKLRKILLLKPQLDVNIPYKSPNGTSSSLVGTAVRMAPIESVKILLEAQANPNGVEGSLSPLSEALIVGNRNAVSLLLAYKANPFQEDTKDHYPILEALRRSSLKVVHKLMESYGPMVKNMNQEDHQRLLTSMLIAAIESGEEVKIRLVLSLSSTFPTEFNIEQMGRISRGIQYLFLFERVELIKHINSRLFHTSPRSKEMMVDQYPFFQSVSMPRLISMIDNSWDLCGLIDKTLDKYWNPKSNLSREDVCQVFLTAIDHGFDINQPLSKYFFSTALQRVLNARDLELARFCIEHGADPKMAAQKIAEKADFDFFEFAWMHGLKDIPETPSQASLLWYVSSQNLKNYEKTSIFKWLVNQGANVNHFHEGTTPYQKVIESGNSDLFRFCLAHGAINLGYYSRNRESLLFRM